MLTRPFSQSKTLSCSNSVVDRYLVFPRAETVIMLQYFKKSSKTSTDGSKEQQDDKPAPDAEQDNTSSAVEEHESQEPSKPNPHQDFLPLQEKETSTPHEVNSKPVLSHEDELFLLRVASEGDTPELPPRPTTTTEDATAGEVECGGQREEKSPNNAEAKKWAERWIEWGIKPTQDMALERIRQLTDAAHAASVERQKASDRRVAADTLKSAADAVKIHASTPEVAEERKEEQQEVGSILNRLDLSSINNRVVGVSHDTQKLLESFNQVLKDIVNGVPTAYQDLEKLLTERQGQLDKLYGGLPPFLKSLIKTIPVKVYATLAPQVAAAMSAEQANAKSDSKDKKKKKRFSIPSLKSLIGQKGAVAGMLRSIISFLEMRFPALLTGTNVIVSLAVFSKLLFLPIHIVPS